MSDSITLIAGPVIEPVTLSSVKLQLGFGPMQDSDRAASQILNEKLRGFIVAARRRCEGWCKRAFITQSYVQRMDYFPGHNLRYEWNGYPEIRLPFPPLQSIAAFQYIDVSGTPQYLTQDITYGVNPQNPQYGYQLDRGDQYRFGRLLPPFARPWPPTRMVPGNVIITFRTGFGGPIVVTTTASSPAIALGAGGSIAKFNPDDAPLLPAETGLPISIPGAGASGATLNTFIASVDGGGAGTLATPAATAVENAQGWAGQPVPFDISAAIMMLVESYYEHGGAREADALPQVVIDLLDQYVNEVS